MDNFYNGIKCAMEDIERLLCNTSCYDKSTENGVKEALQLAYDTIKDKYGVSPDYDAD